MVLLIAAYFMKPYFSLDFSTLSQFFYFVYLRLSRQVVTLCENRVKLVGLELVNNVYCFCYCYFFHSRQHLLLQQCNSLLLNLRVTQINRHKRFLNFSQLELQVP